jgi:hypothetical protein
VSSSSEDKDGILGTADVVFYSYVAGGRTR